MLVPWTMKLVYSSRMSRASLPIPDRTTPGERLAAGVEKVSQAHPDHRALSGREMTAWACSKSVREATTIWRNSL